MSVFHVGSEEQFDKLVASAGDKLVVVDYFAEWCGPCKFIAPVFTDLSKEYTNAVFIKVDVDQCNSLAGKNGVVSMPTFHLLKNGTKIESVVGANPSKLTSLIEQHYVTPSW
eukprot:TRINITY_DN11559_c0_g1_i1.p1 TRINITY_DN11559_c0_g1~~TRINITY_DN11559_c0_g1_i1.p1  ORF type:complete len:112 (+),score=24.66 TRINITY_DN11559_c0_g1_i1:38-373(+)